jgi:hypothetical protein
MSEKPIRPSWFDLEITDKQRLLLYSKGYERKAVDKLTRKQAYDMIKPYYYKDVINYEDDD